MHSLQDLSYQWVDIRKISLDEHTNFTVSALNQSQDLILNESNPFTLAKNPAHQIIFSAISPSAPFNFNVMQVSTTIGDKLYTLSYEAVAPKFSKNLPIIQQMLQSLEIEWIAQQIHFFSSRIR
jgi:hypothetical protein